MRRAVEQTGTTDFVTIARTYQSRSFGFASRNFYPSFLAALTIDQKPEKYFGPLERAPKLRFHEIETPAYLRMDALTRALGVDREALRELNPAIRPPVREGRRRLPTGLQDGSRQRSVPRNCMRGRSAPPRTAWRRERPWSRSRAATASPSRRSPRSTESPPGRASWDTTGAAVGGAASAGFAMSEPPRIDAP